MRIFSKYHVNVNFIKSCMGGLSPKGFIRPQFEYPIRGWLSTLCSKVIRHLFLPVRFFLQSAMEKKQTVGKNYRNHPKAMIDNLTF